MSNEQSDQERSSEDRWRHELRIRDAERAHDEHMDFFFRVNESAVTTGSLALRMALLINGGAAVALLGFDGHFPVEQMKTLAGTLLWFAWGVVASAVGLGLAHFANYSMAAVTASKKRSYKIPYVSDSETTWKWKLANRIFQGLTVIVGIASLALFVIGMFEVRAALT